MKNPAQSNYLGEFNLVRAQMVPKFNESSDIEVLNAAEIIETRQLILRDRESWLELIQKGNYKLTANVKKYDFLYHNLVAALSEHLACNVKVKTPLDFFLFDQFNQRWEQEPSGFIHNDWMNYSKCMQDFANPEDVIFYDPSHAVALVLAITLPEVGSGIELYDAFHAEKGVNGKALLSLRAEKKFSLRKYRAGYATLFCPFQYHSGHCAEKGTLKETDSRMVLVAFLVKYKRENLEEWHMFRMCKGATLEYGDESLYGLPEDILA